ncbi:helix-turn-helix domain-containing protein [Paenibacillus zeisoli]|uniref:Helix-turn-helix domain-containing protein n=1 Tax=Paenibacillus zeisoli TaxID=2496267 RepID=A0A3S1B645_9BACL|nr:helix-turn-helix transcriptional regulator [Paenibacillus zeisoli]RUT29115.1 helix-turn-helix domain-containing protein [Paenibacillus zeisoli]
MTIIGERIKHLRKQRGMTQTDLAGEHMTKSMLSQIENGKALPSMRTLQYLAEKLGEEAGYFLGEEDERGITDLVREIEVDSKKKAYEEVVRKVLPLLSTKLPMTIDVARIMEFYAEACFHTVHPGGEEAVQRAVEIYERFGLYVESSKARYLNYAHLFSQGKYGSSLDLIREVRREYEQKKIGRDVIFELDLYYAEAVSLSALGMNRESRDAMLAALALSKEQEVYYMTDHFLRILGKEFYDSGEKEKAAEYRQKARVFAEFTGNRDNLAYIEMAEARVHIREGRYEEALAHIENVARIQQKKSAVYWLELGIYYYHTGQAEAALDAFSRVVIPETAYHPSDRSNLYAADAYMARLYAANGQTREAKELSARAYEKVKDFPHNRSRKFIEETYLDLHKSE